MFSELQRANSDINIRLANAHPGRPCRVRVRQHFGIKRHFLLLHCRWWSRNKATPRGGASRSVSKVCGCVFVNCDFLKLYEEGQGEMGGGWEILCGVAGGGEWLEEEEGWNRCGLGRSRRGFSRTGDAVALLSFGGVSGACPTRARTVPVLSAASAFCNLGGLLRGISGKQIRRL